ncbi:hypothetical protein [Streptomyces sp. NPDC018059]|uniref:hypothetical protein n=1 Tax=Streptomyces sp. NPDC018059 TaxID=3365041 RepID=UPI0037B93610
MSKHRENVTWQAPDGTWSIGFFAFTYTKDTADEDFDDEWDVEYHDDRFWFLSTGHPNPDAPMDHYCTLEPNPGGGDGDAHDPEEVARYEQMAADFKATHGTSFYGDLV